MKLMLSLLTLLELNVQLLRTLQMVQSMDETNIGQNLFRLSPCFCMNRWLRQKMSFGIRKLLMPVHWNRIAHRVVARGHSQKRCSICSGMWLHHEQAREFRFNPLQLKKNFVGMILWFIFQRKTLIFGGILLFPNPIPVITDHSISFIQMAEFIVTFRRDIITSITWPKYLVL